MSSVCSSYAKEERFDRCSDIVEEPQRILLPIEGYEKMPLVPLEESVEPLIQILPDIRRKVYIAKENSKNPKDGLTVDESASIRLYSMEWEPRDQCLYFALNKTLRAEDRQKLKPWFRFLRLILTALTRLPSHCCNVYRGVQINLSDTYRQGTTFVWWGFSSCTENINVLQSEQFLGTTTERTLFTIKCHSGKDVRQHSYYKNEAEILLLPARQFKVVGCLRQSPGLHLIQLEEIEPPYPFLEPIAIERRASPSPVNDPFELPSTVKLQEVIDGYQSYTQMNLSYQYLTDHHMEIVVQQAIINKQCAQLQLSNNEITSEGVSILASVLPNNTTLEALLLSNNRVCDAGAISLAQALKTNSTLKTLGLGSNDITDEGVEQLARMLRTNHTIIQLALNNNRIGDRGVQLLLNTLTTRNTTLQMLNLSSNKLITESSIDALLDLIECNRSLNELYVHNCSLSAIENGKLRQVAKSRNDFYLNV